MELGQAFPMAASTLKTGWLTLLFGGMLVLWVGVFSFLSTMVKSAAEAEIRLRNGMLTAKGGVYGRTVPVAALKIVEAKRVTLGKDTPEWPKWRTNGIGLEGLLAGWFRLASGEKALVFVTDKSRAVRVPTTLGYSIVISPENPERFLEALRNGTAGAGRENAPEEGAASHEMAQPQRPTL